MTEKRPLDEIVKLLELAEKEDGHLHREDCWRLVEKVKELRANRDYWSSACKEAQEYRDRNAVLLEQAEPRIKVLEKAIGEVLDGTLPYIAEQRLKKVLEEK